MDMYTNVHENVNNVGDLTDAEFEAVETVFFEKFGHDKNSSEIEILERERLEQSVAFHCLYQNNPFVVRILH